MLDKKAGDAVAEPEYDLKGLVDVVGFWAVQVLPGGKLKMIGGGQMKLATSTIKLPPGKVASLSAIGPSVLMSNGDLFVWQPVHSEWERVGNLKDEQP